MKIYLGTCFLIVCLWSCNTKDSAIARKDHHINNGDLSLFVREIQPAVTYDKVLLMLHGGGGAGIASFDLPVPGGSFAAYFVEKGVKVYLMDIRGWGGSTDPQFDPETDSVNVSYQDAAEDMDVVVDWILAREKVQTIDLLGWATGGHWGGYYCTIHGDKIGRFVSLNSLYPIEGEWGLNDGFADPKDSTKFDTTLRGWRVANEESLTISWDRSIPVSDKNEWRDSLVAKAYREEAVNTDISFPNAIRKMKVPADFREESFYMAKGRPYWNAKDIPSRCLVIRGGLDFWSRPIDLIAFKQANQDADTLTISSGTHFVFLERLEKGKQLLIDTILRFLNS